MAVAVKTGDDISLSTNMKIRQLLFALEKENISGVTEMVPAYNELMICYQPWVVELKTLVDKIHEIGDQMEEISLPPARRVQVPVCYGGEYGPDLAYVAQSNKFTEQQVISRHTAPEYYVYMLGFSPGFCYLGGLDPSIATPRKENPRTHIPAGAVGIAGNQTGIYPLESPGGWQIIGKTPLELFDPDNPEPFLYQPGDIVCFHSIDTNTFQQIKTKIENRTYNHKIESS